MDGIKTFFREAGTAIKENLPDVLRDTPYSAAALFVLGAMTYWLLRFLF